MTISYTYLNAVNAQLRRNRVIQGDSQQLATSTVTSTATGLTATGAFTDSQRQAEVDISRQLWNEVAHELYTLGGFAPEMATATMLLVANTREYTMPSDFERFAGIFRGATRTAVISEYPGGYGQMLQDQAGLASQWQGDPNFFAISPVTVGTIRLDTEGTATWTYNVLYEKRIALSSATDLMPWSDTITDSLVPFVANAFERIFKKQNLDEDWARMGAIRALEQAGQAQRRTRWGPSVGRG